MNEKTKSCEFRSNECLTLNFPILSHKMSVKVPVSCKRDKNFINQIELVTLLYIKNKNILFEFAFRMRILHSFFIERYIYSFLANDCLLAIYTSHVEKKIATFYRMEPNR